MGVQGLRTIVVEDEALLLLDMQDLLEGIGCIVVGTASRLGPAEELAKAADYDVALLDMNLAGERIDPVAALVMARGAALVFISGYGQRTLPPGVAAPVVDKPCTLEKLLPLLRAVKVAHRG